MLSRPLRLALPLLALLPAALRAQDRVVVQVTASALNVREAPMGRVLGTAAGGTRLVAAAAVGGGGWLRVDWGGAPAWASGGWLRAVPGAAVVVQAESLNVRAGPSTAQPRIALVRRGQAYAELGRSGEWSRIQLDAREGWVHRAYVRDLAPGGTPGTAPAPAPAPAGGGWAALHRGLALDGVPIPRRGLANGTLRGALGVAVEPQGELVTRDGRAFVSGLVSWFGGPRDTGVTSTETGAITGERLRALNAPLDPSAADLRDRPAAYYYVAMRFDYGPQGRAWWARQRLLIVAPGTGRAVVVRPVDWGPHTRTGRILDLSPQALRDLGLSTDQVALVAFADPAAPLGPVR